MVESDRRHFAGLMDTLAELYGPCSVLKQQAYWLALLEYDFRDVEAAAIRCMQTRQSRDGYPAPWPTPGDLIALMYRNLDRDGVADPPERKVTPLDLDEHHDPAVYAEAKARFEEIAMHTADRLPRMPAFTPDEIDVPTYGEVREREAWLMTEKHWRARWDLVRLTPDMRFLVEQIPDHYRLQFAQEDKAARQEVERPW